jgi:hypothetical protein
MTLADKAHHGFDENAASSQRPPLSAYVHAIARAIRKTSQRRVKLKQRVTIVAV